MLERSYDELSLEGIDVDSCLLSISLGVLKTGLDFSFSVLAGALPLLLEQSTFSVFLGNFLSFSISLRFSKISQKASFIALS